MFNTAIIVGRVGNKESKILKNGGEITVLSIATSKKWKTPTGEQKEQTTWHNVNCFSKLSEIATKYVHVGDLIIIHGEIQNKKIESGERAGQYMYSIHASDIKFIPTGNKSHGQSKPAQRQSQNNFDFYEDDIPPF